MEKLVRDLIPIKMQEAGLPVRFRIAHSEERLQLLAAKLVEEANEFRLKPSIEELADTLEVLRAVQRELGIADNELEASRDEKAIARGRFDAGLVLTLE
ncbi:nucleoside triphosphate pyrophosphohydrolase [Mesorhizobium sp. B1-1-5]|uniref:nucleoside triphosphate pyrophosphohydrolase n=1 Tax=Mesorhizobium sp. B1-1-5 TaxID=2589979 RepID=UPI00112BC507|nr:nucleoside triphosphate pyrophosphohydrolase [Mesorhizobium sp. B1-1-5]TPO13755.1 phosphoribosyl-ATP pyrophosphohydrolase [Mesorhizobium sp. B1-1-5]